MFKKLILAFAFISLVPFGFSCDNEVHYCKEMSSCEQAQFKLNQCGMSKLDRDNDGIPCENFCGKDGSKAKSGKEDQVPLLVV